MPGGFRRRSGGQGCVDGGGTRARAHRRGTARRLGDHGRRCERARKQERIAMGRIICCGLGPGDPDLMCVRADREVRAATHVAYFRKKGRPGQARTIVEGMLRAGISEYPMEYPVTTELAFNSEAYARLLAGFHDEWANRLVELARTSDVVV